MSSPKYTGFGSRIVLDTQSSKKNESKENVQSTTRKSARDHLNVDIGYFTVKVNPNGDHKIRVEEALGKCFGQGFTVESRPSPTNTASNESFHSCRSTSSQPEEREEGVRGSGTTSRRNKNSRDEELFNQLTMVNAIFLNNSVGHCVHEEAKNARGDESRQRKPSCSTAKAKFRDKFAEDESFMRNVCGDNASTQMPINKDAFAYFSSGNTLREGKWNPEMSGFKPYNREVKRVDSVTSINSDDSGKSSERGGGELDGRDRKLSTSVPGLVPKDKRRTAVTSLGGSKLSDASGNKKYNSRMEMRKQEIRGGENVRFVETYFLKQSFVELLPKMNLDRPIAGQLKERDCSDHGKRGKVKTLKRLEKVDKRVLLKNLKLSKDTKLVSSVAKIVTPPLHRAAKEDKKDSTDVTCSVVPNRRKNKIVIPLMADTVQEDTTDVAPPSSVSLHHPSAVGELAVEEELERALAIEEPLTFDRKLPLYENFPIDQMTDIVYMKENLASVRRRNRRACRLSCPLPVIREESLESVESNDSENSNKSDDYCLVDELGRTIHLFDDNGLPLTDDSGRPLRDAEGRTLLQCDSQGVPLVNASASVFDHLGRHALDSRFSPWGSAAAPPARRLCAPSGRPLLLFDSRGRPLTGAGGELLLDRLGRPLLTLNV